jgi:hypothetical protein
MLHDAALFYLRNTTQHNTILKYNNNTMYVQYHDGTEY